MQKDFAPITAESAARFFDELGAGSSAKSNNQVNNNNMEEQKQKEDHIAAEQAQSRGPQFITETVSKNSNWDEGAEGLIKRSLLIGNLELAAEVALKAGRTTEALLIAMEGGQELLDKIREAFFEQSKDPFVKHIIKAIVDDDFKELVTP